MTRLCLITALFLLPMVVPAESRVEQSGGLNAAAGEELWNRVFVEHGTGQERRCASCHTSDPRQSGTHAKTGKYIAPMAPSANPERLTDDRKIAKWFKRNCKWTLGRECTPREQGDVLVFLRSR